MSSCRSSIKRKCQITVLHQYALNGDHAKAYQLFSANPQEFRKLMRIQDYRFYLPVERAGMRGHRETFECIFINHLYHSTGAEIINDLDNLLICILRSFMLILTNQHPERNNAKLENTNKLENGSFCFDSANYYYIMEMVLAKLPSIVHNKDSNQYTALSYAIDFLAEANARIRAIQIERTQRLNEAAKIKDHTEYERAIKHIKLETNYKNFKTERIIQQAKRIIELLFTYGAELKIADESDTRHHQTCMQLTFNEVLDIQAQVKAAIEASKQARC